jgi:hypothetical protein
MENNKQTCKTIVVSKLSLRRLIYHDSAAKCVKYGTPVIDISWVDMPQDEICINTDDGGIDTYLDTVKITDAPNYVLETMAYTFCPKCLSAEKRFAIKLLKSRSNNLQNNHTTQ